MLGGTKIAILQGSYWLNKANKPIQQKIKKKGYSIGQIVGNFELTEIDKTSVTLDNKKGHVVRLRLTNRTPEKVIQRAGTALFQKKKGGIFQNFLRIRVLQYIIFKIVTQNQKRMILLKNFNY